MNQSYFDAVIFKPKCNIVFHGFGLFANYNGHNLDLKVAWAIGEEKSDEFTLTKRDDEKDSEKKWHTITLNELGVKPIKVLEGTQIHVMAKVTNDNCRRVFYGYEGYHNKLESIPDQDFDFETEYSSFNDNSTNQDWGQFPFILYSK